MAVPNRRIGRPRLTLILLVLTSVTLLTLDFRDFGPLERAQDVVRNVVAPLRSGAERAFDPVSEGWDRFWDYDELEQQNQELQAEIDGMRAEIVGGHYAELINEQLAAELGLETDIPTQRAQVVGAAVGNFDPYVIEIDKGTSSGVREEMPVLSSGALVGEVIEAGSRRSRVRLISDPELLVGVLLVGSDERAIARGGGEGEPLRVEQAFDAKVDVAEGDVLVTSGVRGSTYPPGIAVGTVTGVEVSQGSLEKRLDGEPAATPESLRFVTVLLFEPVDDVIGGVDEDVPSVDGTGIDGTDLGGVGG